MEYNQNNAQREFGWDDVIANDSDFVLLPEGEYTFTVEGIKRARYAGGKRLPPCNQAVVTLKIASAQGDVAMNHNLFLHSKVEGLLCAFFTCIGLRKHGEQLQMNWNAAQGSKGRCKLGVRTYEKKGGGEGKANEVLRFLEPQESAASGVSAASAPSYQPGAF